MRSIMMNLIIHDLDSKEWAKVSIDYAGWNVVTDNGAMHPCTGCFACWNRTPGTCVIKDGYENMAGLIHGADEVVIMSRYTYGGFSGSVKNIIDRCLGYVLPQFELTGDETHHMRRYDEDKPFTFIFYGPELSDEQKADAERYVKAVCANFRSHVKSVEFRTDIKSSGAEAPKDSAKPASGTGSADDGADSPVKKEGRDPAKKQAKNPGHMIILNGSMRNKDGNSARFAGVLRTRLRSKVGASAEIIDLKDNMKDMEALADDLTAADKLIFCVPLYVDGLPSQVIRLMEIMESKPAGPQKIYVLANMGLYESSQMVNLFNAVKQWCERCGHEYCGGLGISAGELIGALMKTMPFGWGATKKASISMTVFAEAILSGRAADDLYAEPHMFPRSWYIKIANSGWDRMAKQNGLSLEDLYRKPELAEADVSIGTAVAPDGLNADVASHAETGPATGSAAGSEKPAADISASADLKTADTTAAEAADPEPAAAYLEGIRPVSMDHAARYGEIYAAAFSGEPWNDPWDPKDAEIHVRELLESKQSYGLEYVLDGKVAGFILGTSMLFHYGRVFEINDLAVDPACQGRGIAKTLLERCLTEMKKRGMAGVNLITEAEGFLPGFYEKYGFSREDRVILMGKEL